jgi:uncharacterized OB-fold protein
MESKCSVCKAIIFEGFNFCPQCGRALKEIPYSIPKEKQISTYFVSFLVPVIGLYLGIKYLFHKEEQVKQVGIIAIMLANLAFAILFWFAAQTITTAIHNAITEPQQSYPAPQQNP